MISKKHWLLEGDGWLLGACDETLIGYVSNNGLIVKGTQELLINGSHEIS